MLENKNKENSTPKKKTSTNKIDEKQANLIFFAVLVVGLIFFTVLFLLTPSKTQYEAYFGDIRAELTLTTNKGADMNVYVEDTALEQHGDLSLVEETEEYAIYEVTFEDETVTLRIEGENLTMTQDSGEVIEFQEVK